jgi:hypothetical protein
MSDRDPAVHSQAFISSGFGCERHVEVESGEQNYLKQKQRQSDIGPQNGPILTRKTDTTQLQLYDPLSTYF